MRNPSIDVLRGLAILLMIQVHFVDNLSAGENDDVWLHRISTWLGMIPAALFAFVSGASYVLWLRKQESLHRSDEETTKISLRRGLFLFGTGFAFNILIWLPEGTFNWDILTLLGTALMLLACVRHLPRGALALACLMVFLLSPLVRAAAGYASYWEEGDYSYDATLHDVLLGFIANGFFPLLPWIIFPVMGFVVGDAVYPPARESTRIPRWIIVTGISLICLSLLGLVLGTIVSTVIRKHYLSGFTEFPASAQFVVGMLGVCIVSVVLLHTWLDRGAKTSGHGHLLTFFRRYSTFSLTIYILHHVVHLWPLWVYGTWMQGDPTYYWQNAISTSAAMSLAAAFMVLCYPVLIFLERQGGIGFESLMRWICE